MRVELVFPPLVERGGAGRSRSRSQNCVQQRGPIDRTFRTQIKTNRCCQQNKQRQSRFHQLANPRRAMNPDSAPRGFTAQIRSLPLS